ncbi:MAG TPA: prolyl oligopeptidase family serine peptidase [Pirellulales bacterium]|nr:prolyl oligopeptidase family serine peptidase [Pirellulales bacterium]
MNRPFATRCSLTTLLLSLSILFAEENRCRADGPADNVPGKVRPVPPPGIEVPKADRDELEQGLNALGDAIKQLADRKDARTQRLLPDVQVFQKAVHDALIYDEFLSKGDIDRAKTLLKEGRERAEQLLANNAPWDTATGSVVRGYVSRIDGSVQPYGVIVPESYAAHAMPRHPLDIWFHGRNEDWGEVRFVEDHLHSRGEFTPPDTIVLHPYGRYCNAFKFAGETDVLEALESVKQHYRIDEDRIAVRGFSMGGAACWHFAVHYPGQWVAANPGAGFAETPAFLKVFQSEEFHPSETELKLLHLYDCTDWAVNLYNCPTVAYSGEIDKQKQAADIMAAALDKEGITLRHVIGPGTAHKYHPEAKKTVERLMASIVERGRDRSPPSIHFETYTLRYNQLAWATIDALDEHWERARIDADGATITTRNIAGLTFDVPAGGCEELGFDVTEPVTLTIDNQEIEGPRPLSDRSWFCQLHKDDNGNWALGAVAGDKPRKRHGLQGPIDDAFMDSFLFVRPTGQEKQPAVEKWVKSEMDHAIHEWRRQFRGEARVKDDSAIDDADIAGANLVLWGTPESNSVLKRIAGKLPIRWEDDQIVVGEQKFPADQHALILICPNPLNPSRYVVLNSGFTYREYDYLNNARQIPKLPDWAVIDLGTPPDARAPGKVAASDFFDEHWQLKK